MIKLKITVLLFLLSNLALFSQSTDILWGYTSESEAGSHGSSSSSSRDGGAIYVPAAVAQNYKGSTITSVRALFANPATNVQFFIGTSPGSDDLAQSTTVASVPAGWYEQELVAPYTITGEAFYVGYFGTGYNIISFSSEKVNDGSWFYYWNGWNNLSWLGTVNVEFRMKGKMAADATLEALQTTRVKTGEETVLTLNVRSLTTDIDGFTIRGGFEGSSVVEETYVQSLAAGESATVEFPLPAEAEEGDKTLCLYLTQLGSQTDGNAVNDTLKQTIAVRDFIFNRNVLVEEWSGTWCGYCTRAIYAVEQMEKKFGSKDFIGMAIYQDDRPVNYDETLEPNDWPTLYMNSISEVGSTFASLEDSYANASRVGEAGLNLKAEYGGSKLRLYGTVQFDADHADADYRLVYYVLENQVRHKQRNYADGGEEYGTFNGMGAVVDIKVDHVVRGIYPGVRGTKGSIPAQVEKGVVYSFDMPVDLPATMGNAANGEVVLLLINAANKNEILNAVRVPLTAEPADGELNIGAAGFATLFSERPYVMPAGVNGALVRAVNGGVLKLDWKYSEGRTVPAATALLLRGKEGCYPFAFANGSAVAETETNLLRGGELPQTTTGGVVYYMLSYGLGADKDRVGFYYGNPAGSAFVSCANRAYLALPNAGSDVKAFYFDEAENAGEVTKIAAAGAAVQTSPAVFDLAGRRLAGEPHQGIYVKNGRKHIK